MMADPFRVGIDHGIHGLVGSFPPVRKQGKEPGNGTELRARLDRIGLASGHAWAPCDVCGEEMLLPRDEKPKPCKFTPRCPGHHQPPADRPTPLQAYRAGLVTIEDIRRHPSKWGPRLVGLIRKSLPDEESERRARQRAAYSTKAVP